MNDMTSVPGSGAGRKNRVARAALAIAVAGTFAAVPVVAGATAAQAASNMGSCGWGTWGGVWAWGDCQGSDSNVHHRLHASCTWGQSAVSTWFTNGHIDIRCPGGSSRSAWMETAIW